MGTIDVENKSRKRKRDKSLNQSALEAETQNENEVLQKECPTPEQKPAKKRKKSKQNDSIVEDAPVIKEDTKKKNKENDSETPSKTKKKNKVNEVKEVNKKDSIPPANTKTKKKEKKKSTEEEKEPEVTKANGAEKKKKKKEKKAPFGVVDSKLLEKSGGDSNMDEDKQQTKTRINRAVDYLHLWKNDRKSWKFNKNLQSMLLKAIYNPVIINEDDFEILLLYFQDCKGGARDKLKADAMALMKEDDLAAEPVDPDMEKRAREITQMLG